MAMIHRDAQEPRRLVSVEEAAQLLGIGKTLAWDMVYRRQLWTICLGKRVLVPLTEIDRIVEGALR